MDINQFLNPADEEVFDNPNEIDDIVLSQFEAENNDSGEEDDWEPLPQISPSEALESLYKLRLFEEQQADGNQALISLLIRHERVLLSKKIGRQYQADIRSYFS